MALKKLENAENLAFNIKFIAQMFIGFIVFIVLVWHAAVEFFEVFTTGSSNIIDLHYTFKILSYGLGISAGIEMAFMLFTEGPDEAVEPIILGLSSTILYALSVLDIEKTDLMQFSVFLLSIGLLIGGLFYVRRKFIEQE